MSVRPQAYVEGCEFCAIGHGTGPATVVCEAPAWLAFFPLDPATPGHTLVIPRLHFTDLWEVERSLAAELMAAVIHVGRAIQAALEPEGMNMITSAGETAEQSVFHLHLHLVPRWRRDGFGRIWPIDRTFEDVDIDSVTDRVRAACADEIKER